MGLSPNIISIAIYNFLLQNFANLLRLYPIQTSSLLNFFRDENYKFHYESVFGGSPIMEKEILEKFEEQSRKLDKIYDSTEKSRKYFLWSLIFNVVIFVLPLIGLMFAIPWFLQMMSPANYGL